MTWTAPHSWVVDEEITAQLLNETRDNLLATAHPYDYLASDLEITNNATDQTFYSKLITGGDMGTNGLLLLEVMGEFVFLNAASDTVNIRLKFGGVTHVSGAFSPNGGNLTLTEGAFCLRAWIYNRASASAQWLKAEIETTTTGGAGGQTSLNNWLTKSSRVAHARPTIDTASDQTLIASVQWSAASPNNTWRRRAARLQLAQN